MKNLIKRQCKECENATFENYYSLHGKCNSLDKQITRETGCRLINLESGKTVGEFFTPLFGGVDEDVPLGEPQTVRERVLDDARRIVTKDRENQYGAPEDNFGVIADLWTAYLDIEVEPKDVALMMALLKIARESTGTGKYDNLVDGIGYFACAAELAECE